MSVAPGGADGSKSMGTPRPDGPQPTEQQFDEGPCKLRYSIRYMPADARLFDNEYEAALREKGLADGAPLAHAGEYYPQVWPKPIRGERWRVRLGLLKQDGFTKPPPVPSS